MGSAVELEVVVGLFRPLRVSRAEEKPVRLRLGQQLFDKLETLCQMSIDCPVGEL